MNTNLTWKCRIFSNSYNLYKDGQQIGRIKNNCFSQSAEGDLNGVKYTFKTRGLLKQHTQILDEQTNNVIGEIRYNTWMTKATISLINTEARWKYENIWNTKWSISSSDGIQITYWVSSTTGEIESNRENNLLLLTGLYVTNYYWQMSAATIIIIFIPIWTSLF